MDKTKSSLTKTQSKDSFSTASEAFSWIESFYNAEKNGIYDSRVYRLDRMQTLLDHFDHPERKVPAIHIAGSKGKGSTSALLASIFTAAGLKAGLYSSPHLTDYRERITLNGEFFSQSDYIKAIQEIKNRLDSTPTVFELLTLTAFMVFANAKCDIMVIETGLGGRLDATNCIQPILSVITRIEKEHTEYLGNTLQKIAAEKGGIIKSRTPLLVTPQKRNVHAVLKKIARKQQAPLYLNKEFAKMIKHNKNESPYQLRFSFKSYKSDEKLSISTTVRAPGPFQKLNSITAASAAQIAFAAMRTQVEIKSQRTPANWPKILKQGISTAKLRGRMEKISASPIIYIDGAHTPVSFSQCCKTFHQLEEGKRILIFSAVEGKDVKKMISAVKRHFQTVIVTSAGTFRKSDPEALFILMKKQCRDCRLIPDITQALNIAKQLSNEKQGAILAAGSFFLVGEIDRRVKVYS